MWAENKYDETTWIEVHIEDTKGNCNTVYLAITLMKKTQITENKTIDKEGKSLEPRMRRHD